MGKYTAINKFKYTFPSLSKSTGTAKSLCEKYHGILKTSASMVASSSNSISKKRKVT